MAEAPSTKKSSACKINMSSSHEFIEIWSGIGIAAYWVGNGMWVETGSRFIGAGLVRFYRRQLRQGAMAMAMKPANLNYADEPPTAYDELSRVTSSTEPAHPIPNRRILG